MSIEVLFIHSAGSQSGGQGSSSLLKHLRDGLGTAYNIISPKMPAPTKPSYERWKQELDKQFSKNNSVPILIGHSLGGSVLLKYLSEQKREIQIAGLFIIAAPYWGSEGWKVEEFILRNNYAKYLPAETKLYLYQSCDDEVVSIDHLRFYSTAIPNSIVRKLDGGGHTFKDGLTELVQDIKNLNI
ncbi:MAG: serine hydrolase family protein [Gammaproteobacteria bacterium]|nr:MAG: serine hydrolase family protein [Gammaproteobacteria bacterium]